jgi:hypothetical protein
MTGLSQKIDRSHYRQSSPMANTILNRQEPFGKMKIVPYDFILALEVVCNNFRM